MSVPVVILLLMAVGFSALIHWELREVRQIQREQESRRRRAQGKPYVPGRFGRWHWPAN